ncbi:MAG: hypothetical protein JSV65_14815 [Armatimonadota bacterium]|nr:MAG: hypothetical protein JSV65_14815 [Armatimonadota bacterium]
MGRAYRRPFSAFARRSTVLLSFVAVIVLAGCAGKDDAGQTDRSATPTPELRLIVDDQEVAVPLEMMDIFLVEDDAYPETFEIRGPGVLLVGEFPLDVHVDYEADLGVLRGREIAIQASGGERGGQDGQPQQSILTLPGGVPLAVVGGWFVVDESTGPREGVRGDGSISGRISIQVQDEFGVNTLDGEFSVQATTWG